MKKISIVGLSIVIAFVTIISIYAFTKTKKIAYINTNELFNSFKMTREIDKEVKKVEEIKQHVLDSLADGLKRIQSGIVKVDEQRFSFLTQEFMIKRNQFADEISRMKQSNVEKIWKQINQYTADFGKQENYDIILGANGQGSLMYAEDNVNITKEVIEFINRKYEGDR